MTLRALELQIAIPRMQDVGKVQEHLQERPQQEQAGLALEQERKEGVNRTRVLKAEQTAENHIHQEDKRGHAYTGNSSRKRQRKEKEQKEKQENLHPYKGHSLDISF
jgi:hypothetical protein